MKDLDFVFGEGARRFTSLEQPRPGILQSFHGAVES